MEDLALEGMEEMAEATQGRKPSGKSRALHAMYAQGEVVSALIKELRRGSLMDAMYWAFTLHEMRGFKAVARYLYVFACEDTMDTDLMQFCWMLANQDSRLDDRHEIEHAVRWFADAKKKWECEEGRTLERVSCALLKELDEQIAGEVAPRPIPSYALDRHTKAGWRIKKEIGEWDDRLSGDWEGVWWRIAMMEKNGSLPEIEDRGIVDSRFHELSDSQQKRKRAE